jgi:hypothetical protein
MGVEKEKDGTRRGKRKKEENFIVQPGIEIKEVINAEIEL